MGINADGVAPEEFGCFDPLLVVIDSLLTFGISPGAEVSFTVNHDEDVAHTEIGNALFEFAEILHVLSFILEELVDVFEREDVKILLGEFRPFHIGEFTFLESAVVGPLGERDIK